MEQITIRAAEPRDEKALLALAKDFATSFAVEAEAFSRAFSELLTAPDACLIVAEMNRQVVGYLLGFDHATLYANGRVAWVEEIAVHVDARRCGLGTLLMRRFEGWAAGRNCKLVALATRRASDFYEALGYAASATYYRKLL